MPHPCAVLVIDVQRDFFEPVPRPFEADLVVDRINTLLARARSAGVPVVWMQHETADGAVVLGTDGWQLVPALQVADGDVRLRKTTPDSFLRTDLATLLAQWNTQELVVCGFASEFCVDTTTRRAAALGYPVTIAADAHTTHDKAHAGGAAIRAHHNATLADIGSFGVLIQALPSADISF